MIDHIGIKVSDLARALPFYDRALAPLGVGRAMQFPEESEPTGVGYGRGGKPSLWVSAGAPAGPIHIAVAAASRAEVQGFHAAALAAGGTDNGGPGLRPEYHPSYYAAFVIDPDGNNLEAVTHGG